VAFPSRKSHFEQGWTRVHLLWNRFNREQVPYFAGVRTGIGVYPAISSLYSRFRITDSAPRYRLLCRGCLAGALVPPKRNANLTAARLLVSLRLVKVDDHSILRERHIRKIDRDELRPSESAGKAYKDQRTITDAEKVVRAGFDDPSNVGGEQRCLADLFGTDGAADTFQRLVDDEVAAR
jgi:hypothetical protein